MSSAEAPTPNRRGLLDTNIVIHWPGLGLDALPAEAAITTITIAELSAGVHAASTGPERAARLELLQRVESTFEPFAFDIAAARAYGRIVAAVSQVGRSPRSRVADQMIAAIAVANGLPLYTTDTSDYLGMHDVVSVIAVQRPDHG
jgi:predicted nucleic acid-binding protein